LIDISKRELELIRIDLNQSEREKNKGYQMIS